MANWLLYGAYGYTGKLIAAEAVARGHQPVLAGRDAARTEAVAKEHHLDWVALDLDYPDRLAEVVSRFDLVLHAAGPFIHTSQPMITACLQGQAHYLDITGEVAVFQNTFAHHEAAMDREIMLMSGVGLDIVPTDCLALYVANQLPDATWLETAVNTKLDVSAGTVKSAIAGLNQYPGAILVRRDDELVSVPLGSGKRPIRFSNGEEKVMTPAPWGDLVTAPYTTGIGNITCYLALPSLPGGDLATKLAGRLLSLDPLRRLAEATVERLFSGPDEQTRQTARSYFWARAANEAGDSVEAWLECVETYRLSAIAAVHCVEHALVSDLRGVQTPAGAFGSDLVMELEGTRRFNSLPAAS